MPSEGLRVLSNFTALKDLNLSYNGHVTDEVLRAVIK